MKKITLLACAVAFSAATFSQSTITCPVSWKRSNGGSECPGGKLTLEFDNCPTTVLQIDSVYADGVKLNITFGPGVLECDNKNEVIYCFGPGNIPPTNELSIYFHGGGSYSDDGCVQPAGGPLPVVISNFSAVRRTSNVILDWQTSSEVNTKEFVIQKRVANAFVNIGTVKASNRSNGSTYSFSDANSSKGITEYRLQVIDFDGSFKNSEVRPVKGLNGDASMTIYPNPSYGTTTVVATDGFEKARLELMDQSGRMVKRTNLTAGSITLTDLVPGLYVVRLTDPVSGAVSVQKLTVIK